MNIRRSGFSCWMLACALPLLAACAHQPNNSLYQWGSYQEQVYSHFKGESPEQQIQALEKDIQAMLAANKPVPPGMHAHMAMLYAEVGNAGKAQESLLAEKTQYPESSTYVDLLLKNYRQ